MAFLKHKPGFDGPLWWYPMTWKEKPSWLARPRPTFPASGLSSLRDAPLLQRSQAPPAPSRSDLPGGGLPAEAAFSDMVGKGPGSLLQARFSSHSAPRACPGPCATPLCTAHMAKQETPATIPLSPSTRPTLPLRCCDHCELDDSVLTVADFSILYFSSQSNIYVNILPKHLF